MQQRDGATNLGFLSFGLLRDFTFDGKRAIVADALQGIQEGGKVDVAFAERHFLAPGLAGLVRPGRVFAMHAVDPRAELLIAVRMDQPIPPPPMTPLPDEGVQ